jgi:hypothetical protein
MLPTLHLLIALTACSGTDKADPSDDGGKTDWSAVFG